MGLAQFDRAGIARCQCVIFALTSAVPDRSDRMNDMASRQAIARGQLRIAGLAAMQPAALGKQFRPGGAMDRPIDPTAAAKQRAIGGVDDGIDAQRGDVGDDDFQPRRAELADRQTQAEAAALIVTPLSASSCCNSPAWNISRMISQPPTNSPLT